MDKVLHVGDDALNLWLVVAFSLNMPSRLKITGGSSLRFLDLAPLRHFLPELSARLTNVVPGQNGLPIRLECAGILPDSVTLPADLPPDFLSALLLAAPFRERPGRFVLCSMAAGLSIARIQEMAGGDYPVIRIMPNTPASVGAGMIQYCTSNVTAEEEAEFLKLMAPAGRLDAVPESLIDAASCVSGCGPAWVYQFIEALADGGVACGLPRAKAQEYAAQMVLGSAKMVLESGQHPGALKDAVCSPGGSTIQGVRVLEEKGLRGAVIDAVLAAYDKTKEMGKG